VISAAGASARKWCPLGISTHHCEAYHRAYIDRTTRQSRTCTCNIRWRSYSFPWHVNCNCSARSLSGGTLFPHHNDVMRLVNSECVLIITLPEIPCVYQAKANQRWNKVELKDSIHPYSSQWRGLSEESIRTRHGEKREGWMTCFMLTSQEPRLTTQINRGPVMSDRKKKNERMMRRC
jgi:hypothetical protein